MPLDNEDIEDLAGLSGNPIVSEARLRFKRASEWEAVARDRWLADYKFANGDSTNGYQWPNGIRSARDADARPCLTMNIVRQHNLMIANEARKNKSSVKFVAMGNGATQESASILQDIARNIETQSKAQLAYKLAQKHQIDAGIGYWRLVTDYSSRQKGFDQEIFVRPIFDPLSVFLDPDHDMPDYSDINWGFIFDPVPKNELYSAYPKAKRAPGDTPLGAGSIDISFAMKGQILVCEYFRRVKKKDQLVSFVHLNERKEIKKSQLPEGSEGILDDPLTKIRDIDELVVEWYLIVGETIIDKTIWPGEQIPIIPCIGEEVVIDGILDRKGHTRAMLDSQRMFNYNASAEVEFVALQGKTPWTGPAAAIEEFESYWNSANRVNHSFLPTKHIDDEGQPIPQPTRVEPPNASPAFERGMETSFRQMMMTSGQWENAMGQQGNERTGAAIGKRQEQGQTATYHFQDNYLDAMINTSKQMIDLIPKVYDTKRVKKILGDDGVDYDLVIDPSAKEGYLQEINHQNEVIKRIFNPQIGLYDVGPGVGPSYGSKREQTVEALTLILTQNPGLTAIIGDILLSSMDFDKADEAARRLKRMVPGQALGQGPSQQEQELRQQIQSLSEALEKSLQRQAKQEIKLVGKDQLRDIDVYEAETKRMSALKAMLPADASGLKQMVEQLVKDAAETSLKPILDANQNDIDAEGADVGDSTPDQPPLPHAKKAGDGYWYISDPTRKSKYLKLEPLAMKRNAIGA